LSSRSDRRSWFSKTNVKRPSRKSKSRKSFDAITNERKGSRKLRLINRYKVSIRNLKFCSWLDESMATQSTISKSTTYGAS